MYYKLAKYQLALSYFYFKSIQLLKQYALQSLFLSLSFSISLIFHIYLQSSYGLLCNQFIHTPYIYSIYLHNCQYFQSDGLFSFVMPIPWMLNAATFCSSNVNTFYIWIWKQKQKKIFSSAVNIMEKWEKSC